MRKKQIQTQQSRRPADITLSNHLAVCIDSQVSQLELDSFGWVNVNDIIETSSMLLTVEHIKHVVTISSDKRFELNQECTKIRAPKSDSIDVQLHNDMIATPPEYLYNKTTNKTKHQITSRGGLEQQSKRYVELHDTIESAKKSAQSGTSLIVTVTAKLASREGVKFYQLDGGRWLADEIQSKYISFENQ